jgi:hypothetical protein
MEICSRIKMGNFSFVNGSTNSCLSLPLSLYLCLFVGRCDEESGASTKDASDSAELGIDNVGGVFVVLGLGIAGAFTIGILEFLWNCKKVAVEEKVKFLAIYFGI